MKRHITFFAIISVLIQSSSIEGMGFNKYYALSTPDLKTTVALGTLAIGSLATWKTIAAIRTKQQFSPTSSNLNFLFLSPSAKEFQQRSQNAKTIRDLVREVYKGNSINNFCLKINRKINDNSDANKSSDEEIWQVSDDIKIDNDDTFFIYSRGIATTDKPENTENPILAGKKSTSIPRKGGAILETYKYIRDHVISSKCATFDYPDTRGILSFGGDIEKDCLKVAYQNVLEKNPKKIVLVGLCRGASTALAYAAAENPDKLAGVMVESPMVSLSSITAQMAKSFVMGIPGMGGLIYNLFRFWFPSYQAEKDNLLDKVQNISKDVPILIGHLKNDSLLSDSAIHALMNKFKGRSNVYLAVINDKTKTLRHGTLSLAKPFQRICNAFKAKHGLSSDKLNQYEERLLQQAQQNSQLDPQNWIWASNTQVY